MKDSRKIWAVLDPGTGQVDHFTWASVLREEDLQPGQEPSAHAALWGPHASKTATVTAWREVPEPFRSLGDEPLTVRGRKLLGGGLEADLDDPQGKVTLRDPLAVKAVLQRLRSQALAIEQARLEAQGLSAAFAAEFAKAQIPHSQIRVSGQTVTSE